MNCEIRITAFAEKDLKAAADYIEFVLLNPQAADSLLNEAEEKINELAAYPEKYPLVNDPVLKSDGIRLAAVKNYLIFYTFNRQEQTVFIVRFLYSKRDWIQVLKQGFVSE